MKMKKDWLMNELEILNDNQIVQSLQDQKFQMSLSPPHQS